MNTSNNKTEITYITNIYNSATKDKKELKQKERDKLVELGVLRERQRIIQLIYSKGIQENREELIKLIKEYN